jgi:hypothetical protein
LYQRSDKVKYLPIHYNALNSWCTPVYGFLALLYNYPLLQLQEQFQLFCHLKYTTKQSSISHERVHTFSTYNFVYLLYSIFHSDQWFDNQSDRYPIELYYLSYIRDCGTFFHCFFSLLVRFERLFPLFPMHS